MQAHFSEYNDYYYYNTASCIAIVPSVEPQDGNTNNSGMIHPFDVKPWRITAGLV